MYLSAIIHQIYISTCMKEFCQNFYVACIVEMQDIFASLRCRLQIRLCFFFKNKRDLSAHVDHTCWLHNDYINYVDYMCWYITYSIYTIHVDHTCWPRMLTSYVDFQKITAHGAYMCDYTCWLHMMTACADYTCWLHMMTTCADYTCWLHVSTTLFDYIWWLHYVDYIMLTTLYWLYYVDYIWWLHYVDYTCWPHYVDYIWWLHMMTTLVDYI